jgi:hypothetical protein
MRLRMLLASFILAIVAFPARAQTASQPSATPPAQQTAGSIDPAKQADIRRLMELTGAQGMASQFMGNMENAMRPSLMNALPSGEYRVRLIDLFFEKLHSKISSQLVDLAIPAYDKYYSADEIKSLIDFYQTPLGQKVVRVMPAIVGELQASGQKLGETAGREAMIEVLSEHPDLAQALASARKVPAQ